MGTKAAIFFLSCFEGVLYLVERIYFAVRLYNNQWEKNRQIIRRAGRIKKIRKNRLMAERYMKEWFDEIDIEIIERHKYDKK